MLRKVCVFVLWMLIVVEGYAQTKSPGTYRSSIQDGAALSPINFTVSRITGDTLVCVGDDKSWRIKVTGTSVYRYKWVKMNTPATEFPDTSVLSLSGIQLNHASKYYCEVTDLMSGVKKYSDTIAVKVVTKPNVSIVATADTVAAGEAVKLTASGADSYRWSTGASTDTMTVWPRQTMVYTVTGTNGGICTDMKTRTVHVVQMVLDLGPDVYITQGASVTLTAHTNLTQITWYRLVTGGNRVNIGSGLSITQSPAVTTEYEAEGEFKGAKVTARVKVIVRSSDSYRSGPQDGYAESAIHFEPGTITGNTVVCEGESTTFSIKTKGTSVYRYQWKKMGPPVVNLGTDTTVLTLDNLTVADTGYYYCEVTDLRNDSTKVADPIHLEVVSYPEAHIGAPVSGIIICYGDSIVLDARDSEVGRPAGAVYKYSWIGVSGKSDSSVVTTYPSVTRDYIVSVSNKQCTSYDTVKVVVYRPQVDLPFDYYATEGSMTNIVATTSDAVNLDWYVGT